MKAKQYIFAILCFYSVNAMAEELPTVPVVERPYVQWIFDEGEGFEVLDDLGNEDGVLMGDVAWRTGESGYALDFPRAAGSFVQIGADDSDPIVPSGSDFTVSVWFNSDDLSNRQAIYGCESSNTRKHAASWFEIYNGRPAVALGNGTTHKFFANLNGSHPIVEGDWTHWTVVLEGNELRSYINGELVVTRAVNHPGAPKAAPKDTKRELIEAAYSGNSIPFEGRIDDLRVWQKSLDDSLVRDVFYDSMIDVRDFVADGDADHGPAIQRAVDCADTKEGGGGNKFVLLDGGTFIVNEPIHMRSNTKLYGRDATLMNWDRDEGDTGPPLILIDKKSGCEVHDLKIDCNFKGLRAIHIRNCQDVLVENCEIANVERNERNNGTDRLFGVYIQQTGLFESSNIRFQSCRFDHIINKVNTEGTDASCRAVMIQSGPVDNSMSNITIDDCDFSNIRAHNEHFDGDCIQIFDKFVPEENDPFRYFVTNSRFENYSKRGVKCQGSRCYVSSNIFRDARRDVSWAPAIALFNSDSMAESNHIEYQDGDFVYGFTIAGKNHHLSNNTVILKSDPPATCPSSGYPNRNCAFYFGSSGTQTGNLIEKNVVVGGRSGLTIINKTAAENKFTNNSLDVVGAHVYDPFDRSDDNTIEGNTSP